MGNYIAISIRFILANIPFLLLMFALLIGFITLIRRNKRSNRLSNINLFLGLVMLFPVGFAGLWGFTMHAFFPERTAAFIGWATSPFQFEVAIANLSIGLAGIASFNAGQGFRAATTLVVSIFLWGAAAGHIIQMIKTANYMPGNAGLIFYTDLFIPLILIILMMLYKRASRKVLHFS